MKIKFNGKIWKHGKSHVVTIPLALMENFLNNNDKYEFIIKVVEK